jgi:hypothetical protein
LEIKRFLSELLVPEEHMRAFGEKIGFVWLLLAGLLYSSAVPGRIMADEKDAGTPPVNTEAPKLTVKIDAPAPGFLPTWQDSTY